MGFAVTLGLDTLNFMLALLLVTLGLVVIYGLMNVINMAHGEFFLLGAYCVVLMQNARLSFWWALLLAPVMLALVGLAVEELVIRHVYRRFIDSILGTWGISLALKQVVIIVFGPTAQSIVSPIPGPVQILGVTYPAYRLFIMGFTILLAGTTFLFFYRTHVGLAIRGVIANRAMAASLGINTRLLDRSTFAIGAALAGVAGAVMAPIAFPCRIFPAMFIVANAGLKSDRSRAVIANRHRLLHHSAFAQDLDGFGQCPWHAVRHLRPDIPAG